MANQIIRTVGDGRVIRSGVRRRGALRFASTRIRRSEPAADSAWSRHL